jgi:hypothetical protein
MIKIKTNSQIDLLLIMLSILIGCKNEHRLIETNQIYREQISQFEPEFVNHFPKKIEEHPMTIWSDTNAISDHVRIMLQIQFSKPQFDSLNNEFDAHSLARYNAGDSCLLIVNRFTQRENWHLKSKHKYVDNSKIERDCYKTKLPIPNFWDNPYLTYDTDTRLPDDFDIYVFESKSGEFWDKKHRTSGKYIPEKWKNGYSKGIAISKKRKKLIYWFILW